MKIRIDNILNYASAFLFPKIIFLFLKWTSKEGGGAIITSRLKDVSFNIGMEEGIGVFVISGVFFYKLSEYCVEKYYENRIKREQLQEHFLTHQILNQIDTYLISKSLNKILKANYVLPEYQKK